MHEIPVYTVNLPEYVIDHEPDQEALGSKVDEVIKEHFDGRNILLRGIASSEHTGKTIDEVIESILLHGTDRYDPAIAGDRYDNIEGKHIDLFAFPYTVNKESRMFADIVWGFYYSAKAVHGRPMRIDILTIYDADQMEVVTHQYAGRDDIKEDGFAFKYPNKKHAALLGIIKIL